MTSDQFDRYVFVGRRGETLGPSVATAMNDQTGCSGPHSAYARAMGLKFSKYTVHFEASRYSF